MVHTKYKPRNYWNEERILKNIKVLSLTEAINDNYVKKHHGGLYNAGRKNFGSWRNAIVKAGFDYDQIKRDVRKNRIWTDEKIINQIKELYANEQINAQYIKERHGNLFCAGQKYFGSWGNAVKAAGIDYSEVKKIIRREAIKSMRFTPNFEPKWTNEMVISEIKKLASKNIPLNDSYIIENYSALYAQGCKRFNSWGMAINTAGLNYDDIRLTKKWSNELVIEEIQNLFQQDFDLSYNNVVKHKNDIMCTARRRFGTWENALKQAGIEYKDYRKKRPDKDYTQEDIIKYIKRMWKLGKELNSTSIPPQIYGQARTKFGSWRKAVEAAGLKYDEIKKHDRIWSKEKVISGILLFHSKEEPLNARYMRVYNQSLYYAGITHFGSWKNAVIQSGIEYSEIRQEATYEILLGKAFELTFKYMVDVLELGYIYQPRFENFKELCIPDFVDQNDVWIDTKLNSWTATIVDTVKKYLKYTNMIRIIYLKGRGRLNNERVQYVAIDAFYPLLEKQYGHVIKMFEMLKEGKIPDEINKLL